MPVRDLDPVGAHCAPFTTLFKDRQRTLV